MKHRGAGRLPEVTGSAADFIPPPLPKPACRINVDSTKAPVGSRGPGPAGGGWWRSQALLGSGFRVSRHRGEIAETSLGQVTATMHPSAVLRTRDPGREQARADFFQDFARVAGYPGRLIVIGLSAFNTRS